MALDPSLRKQLTEAREAILAEIDELEFRTKNPAKGGAPDYRGPYAELQRQLREIGELLGTDEDAKDCEDSEPVPPDYLPVPTFDPMSSAPAKNVVVDPASLPATASNESAHWAAAKRGVPHPPRSPHARRADLHADR